MKNKIFIAILLVAVLGCDTPYTVDDFWGNGVQFENVDLTGVYVAGYIGKRNLDQRPYESYHNPSDPMSAVLWKDGVMQTLAEAGEAHSVFVSDGDVYVAGYVGTNSQPRAVLWKNGIAQYLSYGTPSEAYSVFVADGDVYAAGYVETYSGPRAVLWKNGVAQYLSDRASVARSVFVAGGDVYVAGEGSDYGSVSLWKNGVAQSLTGVQANSVFVSGNDVYVGLWNGTLWKNGTVQYLPVQRGEARSVFVADGDVYVAGYVDYPLGAVLWKNGIEQRLTAGGYYAVGGYNAWANSVFVSDSDVYVAGHEHNSSGYGFAIVWKNNKMVRLTDGKTWAGANSVFVVK